MQKVGLKIILPLLAFTGQVAMAANSAVNSSMHSYVQVGAKTVPAFAWCDAPDRILAVTMPSPALSGPDDAREVNLLRWMKNKPVAGNFKYKLGPSEGAAGSSYHGLIPAGFKATRELASKYYVRISNVQGPPENRMVNVQRFNTMQGSNTCRYVPNAAFMGVTGKRTVIVWDEGDAITYTTRNFDGKPGVYVTGGKKTLGNEGGTSYSFTTEDGYLYRVSIDEYGPGGGARLGVQRNNKVLSNEAFLAYSVSVPSKEK